MPVEFALRPRIRLREAPAPVRRARPRLPKFALPALAYWLVIAGLVFEFVRRHDASAALPEVEAALAPLAPAQRPAVREWWRPLPAKAATPAAPSIAEPPAATPEPASEPEPAAVAALLPQPGLAPELEPAPTAEPATRARTVSEGAPSPGSATRTALRPAPALASNSNSNSNSDSVNVDVPVDVPALPGTVPAPSLPPAPAAPRVAGSSLPSCEAALASASQDVDFTGGNRAADLPTQAIAAVLENGAWLSSCPLPEHTALDICVAIKGGRVIGASVSSQPADSALNSCVKRRASSLQFPYSPHVDLARTRF